MKNIEKATEERQWFDDREKRRERRDERMRERREQKFARAQLRNQIESAKFINSHQATIQYGLAAIRGGVLLNGGGAIAILSYMATRGAKPNQDYFLLEPLVYFVIGAMLAVATAGLAHVGQLYRTREIAFLWELHEAHDKDGTKNGRISKAFGVFHQFVAVLLFIGTMFTFGMGCMGAYFTLLASVM